MTEQEKARAAGKADWGAAGFTLALLGLLTGVVAFLPVPWWAKAAAAVWLLLCATALLGSLDGASRTHIARSLAEARFTQLYRFTASRQLALIWRRVCDPAAEDAGLTATLRAALTWRLYDAALLLAVAYPILLFVGWWLLGFDGRLGAMLVLPAAPLWPDRAAAAGLIALVLLAWFGGDWAAARTRGAFRKGMAFLRYPALLGVGIGFVATGVIAAPVVLAAGLAGAGAGLIAAAVAGAGTVAVTGAGAGTTVGALSVALAVTVSFTVASAGTAVVIGAFAALVGGALIAVHFLDNTERPWFAQALATAALPIIWIATAFLISWTETPDMTRWLFLIFGVLPLLNALVDVLSYAVTLTLMRRGLRARQPLLYGLMDFAVALVLFLALGAALTAVVAGLNRLAGVPILDLGVLFAGLHAEPHQYWWLYAMVFSTILPTALHGLLSLLGAQALAPLALRRPAARLLAGAQGAAWKAVAAPLAVGSVWALPFLLAAGILYALWRVGADALTALGGFYLRTLTDLAVWIGAF